VRVGAEGMVRLVFVVFEGRDDGETDADG
jgi:hypothetical protein